MEYSDEFKVFASNMGYDFVLYETTDKKYFLLGKNIPLIESAYSSNRISGG